MHWFSENLLRVYYAFSKNSFWSSSWDPADSHKAYFPSWDQMGYNESSIVLGSQLNNL